MLVAGASVRAAATSIRRAGFRPIAVDLFADRDLAERAETYRVARADWPAGIAAQVARLAPMPWMYTGALENHPDLVADLSRRFPLAGVGPDALRAVRDPFRLAEVARRAGFPMPETRANPTGLPTDGSWLIKPVASGGGIGIHPWFGWDPPGLAGPVVWQRRLLVQRQHSAILLGDDSGARLVGVTRQVVGPDFRYAGSCGPVPVAEAVGAALRTLGDALVAAFGLRGLFGVDFAIRAGQPWLFEVNPRYTSSVEVLELALSRSLVAEHLACFGIAAPGADPPGPPLAPLVIDKTILVSPWAGTLVEPVPPVIPPVVLAGRWAGPPPGPIVPGGEAGLWGIPDVADIPSVGTQFAAGDPVLTIFARGPNPGACFLSQQHRFRCWRCWLHGSRGEVGAIRPTS